MGKEEGKTDTVALVLVGPRNSIIDYGVLLQDHCGENRGVVDATRKQEVLDILSSVASWTSFPIDSDSDDPEPVTVFEVGIEI